MSNDVELLVGGLRYSGWESIRITQSLESFAGSFALDVSDRWGQGDPWPIMEGDACRVQIDGQTAIYGFVDKRSMSISESQRSLSYTGRDAAADLVDCSVLVQDASTKGHKWIYRNLDIAGFAKQLAEPLGINVTVQAGLVLPVDPYLVAHPGESGFEAIKRAAGSAGVLVISDGAGGIMITRSGSSRASALIEGVNIMAASIEYDASSRFATYLISSQPPGSDDANGDALRVQAQATDSAVTRTSRVLLIRPDKGMDAATAKRRADWEARVRAARAATVQITVQGWEQPTAGTLWKINALANVHAPNSIGVDGDMLISQVEFSISDGGGQVTTLHLVRPDAFTPEPQTAIVGGEGAWKELAKGAL